MKVFAAAPTVRMIAWNLLAIPFATLVGLMTLGSLFPLTAESTQSDHKTGLFWKIEKPNSAIAPSFLLGTVHATDPQILALPGAAEKALLNAASAHFEGLSEANPPKENPIAEIPDEYCDQLGHEKIGILKTTSPMYGIPDSIVCFINPLSLFTIYSFPPTEFRNLVSGEPHLDLFLEQKARALQKPVFGFETSEESNARYEAIPHAIRIELLASVLVGVDVKEEKYAKLKQAYLLKDGSKIEDLTEEFLANLSPRTRKYFEETFVVRRNHLFVTSAAEHLEMGNIFIAVGYAHLPGPDGVISLLQAKGYRVTKIY